VFDKKIKIK